MKSDYKAELYFVVAMSIIGGCIWYVSNNKRRHQDDETLPKIGTPSGSVRTPDSVPGEKVHGLGFYDQPSYANGAFDFGFSGELDDREVLYPQDGVKQGPPDLTVVDSGHDVDYDDVIEREIIGVYPGDSSESFQRSIKRIRGLIKDTIFARIFQRSKYTFRDITESTNIGKQFENYYLTQDNWFLVSSVLREAFNVERGQKYETREEYEKREEAPRAAYLKIHGNMAKYKGSEYIKYDRHENDAELEARKNANDEFRLYTFLSEYFWEDGWFHNRAQGNGLCFLNALMNSLRMPFDNFPKSELYNRIVQESKATIKRRREPGADSVVKEYPRFYTCVELLIHIFSSIEKTELLSTLGKFLLSDGYHLVLKEYDNDYYNFGNEIYNYQSTPPSEQELQDRGAENVGKIVNIERKVAEHDQSHIWVLETYDRQRVDPPRYIPPQDFVSTIIECFTIGGNIENRTIEYIKKLFWPFLQLVVLSSTSIDRLVECKVPDKFGEFDVYSDITPFDDSYDETHYYVIIFENSRHFNSFHHSDNLLMFRKCREFINNRGTATNTYGIQPYRRG